MSLATQLVSIPEREKSGADTASRYEFQTLWGLALLFQHHSAMTDYAIVFEFHDDVALFDNCTNPTNVRFYQVKSKATPGGWALGKLLERKKSIFKGNTTYKPSFVDRMYDNVEKFGPNVSSVDFVSNQLCNFNSAKTEFRFSECSKDDFDKIIASVRDTYPGATEAQVGLLGFRQTDLSLGDTTSHIKGKLHEFVLENLGDISFNLETVYKAIADDCRRKSAFTGAYASFAQVVKEKGVTKDDVQTWLDTIALDQRAPEWTQIAPMLSTWPYLEIVSVGHQYDTYRSEALNPGDSAIHRVRTAIRKALADFPSDTPHTLIDVVASLFEQSRPVAEKYLAPFTPEKLKAMVIYEIHTNN